MHSAPAVSYPVGRSRFQGWLLGCTGLMGLLLGMLWFYASDLMGWRQGLYALTWLGANLLAVQAWRRAPRGHLRWDGSVWCWSTEAAVVSGALAVHLDFQFFLLLSLRTDTGARFWLWPERRADQPHWHALRCAVFARRSATPAEQAATPDAHPAEMRVFDCGAEPRETLWF